MFKLPAAILLSILHASYTTAQAISGIYITADSSNSTLDNTPATTYHVGAAQSCPYLPVPRHTPACSADTQPQMLSSPLRPQTRPSTTSHSPIAQISPAAPSLAPHLVPMPSPAASPLTSCGWIRWQRLSSVAP